MIRWCQENLAADGFEYHHHDVYNASFNRDPHLPWVRPFPVPDRSVSIVEAWSVFTHLLEAQAEHYLDEMARVLTDDGLLICTFFVFDKVGFPFMQESQNALYINETDPTNAVVFDRDMAGGRSGGARPGAGACRPAGNPWVPLEAADRPRRSGPGSRPVAGRRGSGRSAAPAAVACRREPARPGRSRRRGSRGPCPGADAPHRSAAARARRRSSARGRARSGGRPAPYQGASAAPQGAPLTRGDAQPTRTTSAVGEASPRPPRRVRARTHRPSVLEVRPLAVRGLRHRRRLRPGGELAETQGKFVPVRDSLT